MSGKVRNGDQAIPLSCYSQFDDASFETDRDRMRAVVGPKFRQDIGDLPFDCVLGELQLGCDLLVGVARAISRNTWIMHTIGVSSTDSTRLMPLVVQ